MSGTWQHRQGQINSSSEATTCRPINGFPPGSVTVVVLSSKGKVVARYVGCLPEDVDEVRDIYVALGYEPEQVRIA